jgi:hypothetical protein
MTTEKRNEIYQLAIDTWGDRAQLEMAQEEATELALGIRKFIRNGDEKSFKNMVEEIADVEIMIEQISMMNNSVYFRYLVEQQKDFKLDRLEKRLENKSFEALENEEI